MSRINNFHKVVGRLWDNDAPVVDTENELIVLGKRYEPYQGGANFVEADPAQPEAAQKLYDDDDDEFNETIKPPGDVGCNSPEVTAFDSRISELKTMISQLMTQNKSKPPAQDKIWPDEFIRDVGTRIWLTYRSGFPEIARAVDGPSSISFGSFLRGQVDLKSNGFTSDAGWGCMIRTSQSLLANALLTLHVGRDWRYDCTVPETSVKTRDSAIHDKIVSWFVDVPSAPFSIHNFVAQGGKCSGKKPGEWFGPSAASKSIEVLCNEFQEAGLKVIAGEGDFYENEILETALDDGKFKPILLLAGVRLGIHDVNTVYWDALKQALNLPQSVGIAGGRPSSSHYFFGYQGNYVFYLDPHLPQKALTVPSSVPAVGVESDDALQSSNYLEVNTTLDIRSVHTTRIRQLSLNEMDPSMLIGFLIKDQEDYEAWKQAMTTAEHKVIYVYPKSVSQSLMKKKSMSFVGIPGDTDEFVDLGAECMDFDECEDENVVVEAAEGSTAVAAQPSNVEDLGESTREDLVRRFSQPVVIERNEVAGISDIGHSPSAPGILEESQDQEDPVESEEAELVETRGHLQIGTGSVEPDELLFDKDTSIIMQDETYEEISPSTALSEIEEPIVVVLDEGSSQNEI